MIHWYCNTKKKMSAVVYIIRPSVFISFYVLFFLPIGGYVFDVLDWLVLLFSDCFLEIKFFGKQLIRVSATAVTYYRVYCG